MIRSIAHDQPQKNFKYVWLAFRRPKGTIGGLILAHGANWIPVCGEHQLSYGFICCRILKLQFRNLS